jgi:hypothetical protein
MDRLLLAALAALALLLGGACSSGRHSSQEPGPTTTSSGHTRYYAAPVVLHAGETRRFPKDRLRSITTLACSKAGKRVTLLIAALGSPKPEEAAIPGGPRLQTRYLRNGTAVATCR